MKKLFIIPDVHAPYHDEAAWALTMKAAKGFKPDTVIQQGDWNDNYCISRFPKNPNREDNLESETETCRQQRTEVDELEPGRKVFTEGNHEDRLPRYLMDKAPNLFDSVTTDKVFQYTANDWELVPYQDSIKIGQVYYTHDAGNSGKYPTKGALDTFQHSVCVAHHHRIQYFVEGNATGEHQVGASFGWLGDIDQVDYMHRIKVKRHWALGFGIGYMNEKTGVAHLAPVPIVGYKAVVEGKEYRV